MSDSFGERRPVKSRSWKVSQALATWLVSKNCSPNLISVMGMAAGLVGGTALAATAGFRSMAAILYIIAALCIQLRLLANLLDGMVAIQSGKASRVGELFNEVPDRVSDTAFLVGAGFALGSDPQLGLWAALAAMATAYVRTTGKTAGAPMDFCGPMAKQHRMATLTVACLACSVLAVSYVKMSGTVMTLALWVILVGSVITSIRRLGRTARFLQNSSLREDR
jgi:phosphatidylglycerophosphate synthase